MKDQAEILLIGDCCQVEQDVLREIQELGRKALRIGFREVRMMGQQRKKACEEQFKDVVVAVTATSGLALLFPHQSLRARFQPRYRVVLRPLFRFKGRQEENSEPSIIQQLQC